MILKLLVVGLGNINLGGRIVKDVTVNLDFIDQSYNFWTRVQDLHKNNKLPPLQDGECPVMEWECRYCNFKEVCDERA